ncbi:MAG: cytochrome P450, partial [Acidimicrobiales bacterium]
MEIDLLSVGRYAGSQPHDQFDWLRTNAPVYRHAEPGGPGFWAVTRYEDVRAVGRDAERFSSAPTIMIADPEDGDGVSADPDHQMMLMADPPVHTRMRRLVSADFTPRAAARLQPRIAELATQIVDEVVERGQCDLVADLAGEMPSFVIADVLGIPLEDGRRLYHFTEAIHSSEEVVTHEERAAAYGQMYSYSQQVYAEKRAHPADDLASLLANGVVDDRPIDEVDFFLWFLLLV